MGDFDRQAFDQRVVKFFSHEAERGDPQTFWRELRDAGGPVYYSEAMNEWFVSGHPEVHELLKRASKEVSYSPRSEPGHDPETEGEFRKIQYDTLLFLMDPPSHGPSREIARKTFSGPTAEKWRASTRQWAREALEKVEPGSTLEFVHDVAQAFPTRLTCALFGLPLEDVPILDSFAAGYLGLLEPNITPEAEEAGNAAGRGFTEYLAPFIEARLRGESQSDLLDELLAAERAGIITRYGISAFVLMLMVGGHDTVAGTLANGVVDFQENPAQWDRLMADPSLSVTTGEELLRYSNPINMLPGRFMMEDLNVGGTVIPEGALIRLVLSSANRDPRVFKEPEKFDIGREPNRHLGLGFGPHFCLGASFARVDLQEFFSVMAEKQVRLEFDADQVHWSRGLVHWAPHELPVTVSRA